MDDGSERRVMTVAGRVVLDGIEVLKAATYQYESYALQAVAMAVLGEGKLLTGSHRGQEITGLYHHDKAALAAYNIQDCQLVLDIFDELKLLDFCIARSQLTGLPLDRVGGSVAAFDYQYLPLLHRQGFVAPARGAVPPQASPGGYVLSSQPGLFNHVLVLDFKSLYPSIIRSFCIDPMAVAIALNGTEPDTVPGFAGAIFARHRHLLPAIIAELWQARDQAKRVGDSALSQAIKIIMNSFYGVLGTPGCRFFDPRLASSITRRGHQIITESKEFIEQQGYPVIYGDTDSVFVLVPDCDDSAVAQQAGEALQHGLNQWWRTRLADEYGVDSVLEIEFETHFERFFMPTVRGGEQGSKKRYAGLVREGDDTRVIFKGLENVRSDWTALARDFQQQLYTRIFREQPWQDYVSGVVAALNRGDYDGQLVYRKWMREPLADSRKNVTPHVQAARKALARGEPAEDYRRGEWVAYVMTVSGPEPAASPVARLDYDFYLERQLAPVADSILQFFDTSLEAQVAPQMGMF
jgi:DNA polymerase-2